MQHTSTELLYAATTKNKGDELGVTKVSSLVLLRYNSTEQYRCIVSHLIHYLYSKLKLNPSILFC